MGHEVVSPAKFSLRCTKPHGVVAAAKRRFGVRPFKRDDAYLNRIDIRTEKRPTKNLR